MANAENFAQNGPQQPVNGQQPVADANDDRRGPPKLKERQKWRIIVEFAARMTLVTDSMTDALMEELKQMFGFCRSTIYAVWKEYSDQRHVPFEEEIDVAPKYVGRTGKKRREDAVDIEAGVKEIINNARGHITYDMISKRLEDAGYLVAKSTVHLYCKQMNMKTISNFIRPTLSEENKMKRLRWVLDFIEVDEQGRLWFHDMMDYVYIDEKWFRLEEIKRKLKRFPDSPPEPHYHVQSKSHLTQVMCSVGIARPRMSEVSGQYFNGLLSLMPHIEYHEAQRNSRNRPRGTMVPKPYSITADNFYDALTMEEGLIDAIEEGIRPHTNRRVIIQLDNAPGHTGHGNQDKLDDYLDEQGLDIEFKLQPPCSPDLNMCDLTFFRSLDSQISYLKDNAHDMVGLMDAVYAGFEAYDPTKIEHGFGHLFAVFRKILEHRGGNEFRSPHDNVRANIAAGNPLNFVGMQRDQINDLIDEVNDYFDGVEDDLPYV